MEQINAPYNFVPLSDTVVIPEWGDKVSHDLPFKDGISGELELLITAQTDILVGGRQAGNRVHFFQTEGGNGRYAIPGSSLRGMFRNVMEIATFSRMNAVDEKSYGLRDISKAGNVYQSRVSGDQVKTGFLRMVDQNIKIIPCEMARLDHRDLEGWLNQRKPIFNSRKPSAGGHKRVRDKYLHWKKIATDFTEADGRISCSIATVGEGVMQEKRANNLGSGDKLVIPVFTGQISDCTQGKTEKDRAKKKHKDFVFYDAKTSDAIDVHDYDRNAWKDFLFIHHDAEDKTDTDMSWPNYWRSEFRAGRDVPVFYLQSAPAEKMGRLQIGLAYLPKLAGDFSTYDMIRHTSEKHLEDNGFDFTSLVFGRVGNEPDDALKGRVFFEPAVLEGGQQPEANPPATILNGAKPSYFPNYLKQPTELSGTRLNAGKEYATYIRTDDNQAPELRGWKRYPARSEYRPDAPPPGHNNSNVTTHLHVLPAQSVFKSRIVFHNLKPEELGALLWSVQLEGHRHSLGMGKSFGAGQVTTAINWDTQNISLNNPDPALSVDAQEAYVNIFKKYMKDKWLTRTDWCDTLQVMSLLSMTSPDGVTERFNGELKHMKIDNGASKPGDKNDFVNAKQDCLALSPFKPLKSTMGRKICPWVDETIKTLAEKNRVPEHKVDQVLYGKGLAEAWQALTDEALKSAAFNDIKARWSSEMWDSPQGKATKKAKEIYAQ